MNHFASKLNSVLSSIPASYAAIARKANVDPSLLRRYRKGERFPRNKEIIDKLYSSLPLSDRELQELEEAYFLSKDSKGTEDAVLPGSKPKINIDIISCNLDNNMDEDNSFKTSSISNMDDMISALSLINARNRDYKETVYTMFTHREEILDLKYFIRFILPDVSQGEYLIFSSLTDGQKKRKPHDPSHFPLHYRKKPEAYPCYTYKEECEFFYGSTLIVFTENMLVKCTKYEDAISGFFTRDINIIAYYQNIFETYKGKSIPWSQGKGNETGIAL